MYESIVHKDVDNFELVFNAANILRQVNRNEDAEKLFYKASILKPQVSVELYYYCTYSKTPLLGPPLSLRKSGLYSRVVLILS